MGQSLEEHTKKVVQMHYLARNFPAKLKEQLVLQDNELLFGVTFYYKKIFMGKIGEEYVTIEEFVDGTFRKYVNKNGNVCDKGDRTALFDKAECLAHFTYERSEKEVMLVDIQGCEYSLIDPEIASKELTLTDLLFCGGNLSANAISTFFFKSYVQELLSTVGAFSIGVTSIYLISKPSKWNNEKVLALTFALVITDEVFITCTLLK